MKRKIPSSVKKTKSPASGKFIPGYPIYDLHGHWGAFYGAHLPCSDKKKGIAHLERANVAKLVICHHHALHSPDTGNSSNVRAVRANPERLLAYCAINPNYPEDVARDLESFDEYRDIYVGFKMLSDYHRHPLSSPRYRPVWEMADSKKLIVLAHTWGGSQYDGYEEICKVASSYPNAKILLGHSIHGDWGNAVKVANKFPNVFLELTAVLDDRGILERFVKEAGSSKVIFGTDFPWFSLFYHIGAVMDADISDMDKRRVLCDNGKSLIEGVMGRGYRL